MGRLYYQVDELLRRPIFPGMPDPTHLYYHFRPARPADLVVTRDPISDELNVSAGTYGVLTEQPLTIGLHISKRSFDTARNIRQPDCECVVALPTRDQVRQTWYTALPIPRGISEGEVAGFTWLPSRYVSVPGIAECPVNMECRVDRVKEWHTHFAVFLRVLGASIDEDLLGQERQELIRHYPTHEVDDQTNLYGGSIERLGACGDLLACPAFPVGAKRGAGADTEEWINDLQVGGYLSAQHETVLLGWLRCWRQAMTTGDTQTLEKMRRPLTRALELAAWEEWDALNDHMSSASAEVP